MNALRSTVLSSSASIGTASETTFGTFRPFARATATFTPCAISDPLQRDKDARRHPVGSADVQIPAGILQHLDTAVVGLRKNHMEHDPNALVRRSEKPVLLAR